MSAADHVAELLSHNEELGRDLLAMNDLVGRVADERDRYKAALDRIAHDSYVTDPRAVARQALRKPA